MEKLINSKRTLAYNTAQIIPDDELGEVGGGSMTEITAGTTKQTFNSQGGIDVGVDVIWD